MKIKLFLNRSGCKMLNWTSSNTNRSLYNSPSLLHSGYVIPVPVIIFTLVVILLVSLIGNSIVVLVIKKKQKMRTFTNCLILNLAVADLTVAVICIPLDIPLELNNFRWIYENSLVGWNTVWYLLTVTVRRNTGNNGDSIGRNNSKHKRARNSGTFTAATPAQQLANHLAP